MVFVIHWHESAMDLHVFPIPIPPPISFSTRSLWVFPVHQARALASCIQPGLVICFTLDNIHVSMLFSRNKSHHIGRPGFDPWVGKILYEGKGYLHQYSGLENSMDRIVHGAAKSWTWLSDFHFHFTDSRVMLTSPSKECRSYAVIHERHFS